MANVTTELKVVVRSIGKGEIDKLSASLIKLGEKSIKPVNQDLRNSVAQLKTLSNQSAKTKTNVQGFSTAFKELANNLEFGSFGFKEATAEAKKLDAQLQKMERRQRPAGGRLRAGAQVAGTVAGAGVFGGPEGAIGAGLGAIFGGVPGAVVGGAIGAQVGGLRQAAGGTAEYAASLTKLRIALLGVTTSQAEYQQSLAFIQQTTKDFAIPQEVVTRQFTKLQASVQGAGGNVEDTKTAFNGIVAAVRATGGSLEDVDAALTATAQVFSKGKVSAEELRQQIGERLPGAFTLFAQSIGMTPQELDKALEKGQVSLQDFQKFAEAIFNRYGENAKAIADAPESAGDRLKVALEELSQSVGTLLQPIGQAFQEIFTRITEVINTAIKALNRFLGLGQEGLEARIETLTKRIDQSLATAEAIAGTPMAEQARAEAARLFEQRSDLMVELRQLQTRGVEQPESGTGLPGITPDPDKDKISTGREIKDITEEELDLRKAIVLARRFEDELAQLQLGADLKRLQVLGAQIGERERIARLLEIEQEEAEGFAAIVEKQIKLIEDKEKAEFRAGQEIAKQLNQQDRLQKKTKEALTDTQELIQSIGGVISGGLTDAFQSLITGAKSLKEILADVLSQIGQLFLQFAIRQALSRINVGGVPLVPSAKGNVFAQNKIIPYANGGVIDKPTILPLAGEAGPEAILPLQRGSDGKLGVKSNESRMRESMSRYSRGARGGSVIPENGGGSNVMDGGGGTAVAAPIDVRYTVERINSVDYVTADQFQQGMQQAANQGAKQGEQQTLKRLQMSSSTRKRLGM